MKKNAFTLIELLAVIVILAIIALIATPIVLDIINDTKKSAVKRSSELYISAVELTLVKASGDNIDITTCNIENNNLKCGDKEYKIELEGEYPKEAEIKATKEGKIYAAIKTDGYCIIKREGESSFSYKKLVDEVSDYKVEEDENSCSLTPIYTTSKSCFEFDESTGTITDYYRNDNECDDKVVIPSKINGVNVKILGGGSFANNKLTSVIIPEGVTKIKERAFDGHLFTSLDLPDTVNLIEANSFRGNSLTSLKLPNGYFSLSASAFSGTILPEEDAYIYKRNSDGSIDYTTIIAYLGNSKDLIIPGEKNGVKLTTIGNSVFRGKGLTSVSIPDSVTKIQDYAFTDNLLISLKLPAELKSLGAGVFKGNNITSLELPKGYFTFNSGSLDGCYLPDEYAYIYKRNTDGTVDYTTIMAYVGESKDIVIPSEKNGVKLTTIGAKAFSGRELTSAVIPEGVTTIKYWGFLNNSLSVVEIPSTVKTIEDKGFFGNPIESVTIKNKKENITWHSSAFGSFDTNNIVWDYTEE